jgi:K+-sensing histidine kinase KdpD
LSLGRRPDEIFEKADENLIDIAEELLKRFDDGRYTPDQSQETAVISSRRQYYCSP